VPAATITADPKCTHQRTDDGRGLFRVTAPVRAQLERHDDTGYDAHAERNGEDADPEGRYAQIDLAFRPEKQAFEHRDVGSKPDGKCGQEKVERDEKGELDARKK
jgi:hypothetical protein